MKSSQGFTLVELIVIIAIIGILSGMLAFNFRKSSDTAEKNQAVAVLVSDIRRMQSMALAGSTYDGKYACGYGIHYDITPDKRSYILFVRTVTGSTTCSSLGMRRYDTRFDTVLERKKIVGNKFYFRSQFSDIYYELPDPKVYFNGNSALIYSYIAITSGSENVSILMYANGRIEITK